MPSGFGGGSPVKPRVPGERLSVPERLNVVRHRWPLLIVAALLSVAACSVQTTPTTTPARAPEGGLLTPDCDDMGACTVGFILDDGVRYNLDCAAVKNSAVTNTVIGRGGLQDQEVTVNLIEGVDRSVMVAVSLPGGLCQDGSVVLSDWSMAFGETAAIADVLETICRVGELTDDQRVVNGC